MGMARSTFYDHPARAADDTAIVEAMFAICDEFEFYGYRRVGAALHQQGFVVNHKKIRRLMRDHGLQPTFRRRYVATTDHDSPIFPNLAKDIIPTSPNQLWVGDITYVALPARFVYVAIILDAWSRMIVGYAISGAIDARLTGAALRTAIERRSHRQAAFIIPIVAPNMLPKPTGSFSPATVWPARWAAEAILMTMPKRRAS
jgi:putative transposase